MTSIIIGLSFPYSGITKDKTLKKISYNDAIQSKFVQGFLSSTNKVTDDNLIEIEIPKELYIGLRNKDLEKLMELWLGKTEIYEHDEVVYCYKTIYRVMDALLLNNELPFMKKFNEKYDRNDIIHDLNEYAN